MQQKTMKQYPKPIFLWVAPLAVLWMWGCVAGRTKTTEYRPDDLALYREIVRQDSLFFDAYNHCNIRLAEYAAYYAENVEFYHDKGGLQQSKTEIVEGTKANVCGKVTRELVPGSVEVYPVADFGAVEVGYHRFRNHVENELSRPGRFVIIWEKTPERWVITRVISMH